MLSAAERDVIQGDNLFPVSVAVEASVAAGRYDLCLDVEGSLSEACAEVRVTAREGLSVEVPSELFGDTLPVTLSNEGNRPQTLELRASGQVGFPSRTVTLTPGEVRHLELALAGTGMLELYVNQVLYLVTVKSLDGGPPLLALELRAANAFNFTEDSLDPSLLLEGPLSDHSSLTAQLSGEPFLDFRGGLVSLGVGRLPDLGEGVRLGYGTPWGGEAFYGRRGTQEIMAAGITYRGIAAGRLRMFYDGELWTDGAVEGLELGGWRAAGRVNRQELSADVANAGVGLEFGVRYAYTGPLLVETSFGVGGGARQGLTVSLGDEASAGYRLDFGRTALTTTIVLAPEPRLDWQLGFGDILGPGRYTALLGIERETPTLGGSYALAVPWVPGLNVGAAAQLAEGLRASGTLSLQGVPWRANLLLGTQASEVSVSYQDEAFLLSLDAGLGDDLRVALSGQYTLAVPVPEEVVEVFGGRRWARLEGQVRVQDGQGIAGLVLDAGEYRVETAQDGRYTLWLPQGQHTLRLLPETLPLETIPPPAQTLALAESERRSLDLVLRPAGAVSLTCRGNATGGVGLNLFGTRGSSIVSCGRSVGGLSAGRYQLEPFGVSNEQEARHSEFVLVETGTTRTTTLELRPRPLPEATRPTLTLQAETLLTAAPGEEIEPAAESNAPLVYAVTPEGEQFVFSRGAEGRFNGRLQVPFGYTAPLYTVRLVARNGEDVLERQTIVRLDPTRSLYEASFDPPQGRVGEEVTVAVETRFTPRGVQLKGPKLSLGLAPKGTNVYVGTFRVPEGWRGREEVLLELVLEGQQRLKATYRFRPE